MIHDYAGHGFPVQLSRWLTAQGHVVLHLYSMDLESQTPRGPLRQDAPANAGLQIEGLGTGRPVPKYKLLRRWFREWSYGAKLARRVAAFQPDCVLSANTPPAAQWQLATACRQLGIRQYCWVQDIFSIGVAELLKRLPWLLRRPLLAALEAVEFGAMRRSSGVIAISPDFLTELQRHGVSTVGVIENWPSQVGPAAPKRNAWSEEHGLADKFVFLLSGTLGLKHNPAMLVDLARAYRSDPEVRIVVVSEGLGRAWLEQTKAAEGLDNLLLFDFQPHERLPDVLGSADVSLLLLEDYAGRFSVPSKVYSYFCAARPILAAVPATNLARRLIAREGAGECIDPGDSLGFVAAAARLRADPVLRQVYAERQSAYVPLAFDIERIGPRFVAVALEAPITGWNRLPAGDYVEAAATEV